ncbi:SelB C-terminal domain-containing protein [Nonomuraea basaltis]
MRTTRRVAIPLLEHLDRLGRTRKRGLFKGPY